MCVYSTAVIDGVTWIVNDATRTKIPYRQKRTKQLQSYSDADCPAGFDEYLCMSNTQRKKLKKSLPAKEKASVLVFPSTTFNSAPLEQTKSASTGTFNCIWPTVPYKKEEEDTTMYQSVWPMVPYKKKEDTAMYLYDDGPVPYKKEEDTTMYQYDDVKEAKERLRARVDNVAGYRTGLDLQRKFGLRDDVKPKDFEEFIQRIKDGKYVAPEKGDCSRTDEYCSYGIHWRDPAVKEDQDGYDAAMKELKETATKTLDEIAVYAPAEGLKALNKFEKYVKELVS